MDRGASRAFDIPQKEEFPLENTRPECCASAEGSLPGRCASMVFPYIAAQCSGAQKYEDRKQALNRGTLFPGLDMPFYKEMQTKMNCDNRALCELMALSFAITELGLYLDTHNSDKEAMQLYQSYVALAKEGRKRYEETYGPLRQTSVGDSGWTWINDPWPWDYEGGRK